MHDSEVERAEPPPADGVSLAGYVRKRRSWLPTRLRAVLLEGVYQGGEQTGHLAALRDLHTREDQQFEHDHLYECLNILDGKAVGLLTYNAIVFAATSLVLSIYGQALTAASVIIFVSLLLSAVASSLCLRVVWIFWTESYEFRNPQVFFSRLLDIRNSRTISYRLAWVMSQFAMFLLVAGMLVKRFA